MRGVGRSRAGTTGTGDGAGAAQYAEDDELQIGAGITTPDDDLAQGLQLNLFPFDPGTP